MAGLRLSMRDELKHGYDNYGLVPSISPIEREHMIKVVETSTYISSQDY